MRYRQASEFFRASRSRNEIEDTIAMSQSSSVSRQLGKRRYRVTRPEGKSFRDVRTCGPALPTQRDPIPLWESFSGRRSLTSLSTLSPSLSRPLLATGYQKRLFHATTHLALDAAIVGLRSPAYTHRRESFQRYYCVSIAILVFLSRRLSLYVLLRLSIFLCLLPPTHLLLPSTVSAANPSILRPRWSSSASSR